MDVHLWAHQQKQCIHLCDLRKPLVSQRAPEGAHGHKKCFKERERQGKARARMSRARARLGMQLRKQLWLHHSAPSARVDRMFNLQWHGLRWIRPDMTPSFNLPRMSPFPDPSAAASSVAAASSSSIAEMANALRNATRTPPAMQEFLDRADQEQGKNNIKALRTATTSLGPGASSEAATIGSSNNPKDQTPHGCHHDLGESTGELSTDPSPSLRSSCQSASKYLSSTTVDFRTQCTSGRDTGSTTTDHCRGDCKRRDRYRAQQAARCFESLRKFMGRDRPKRSYRINQRRQPHQTRSEIETTNYNAPPILAKNAREHRPCAISFTNDLHEAMFCVSPFIHSVMWEVDYCSPNAVAWRLRWEVLAHECPAWQNDVHRSFCYQEPSYGFQQILFADVSQVPSDEHCRKRQIHFAESTY